MRRTQSTNARSQRSGRGRDALHEVANRSAEVVLCQLPCDVLRRDPAEVRGYVRARAAVVVREQIAAASAINSATAQLSTVAWNDAVDRTMHLVLHRLWSATPTPQARRAA